MKRLMTAVMALGLALAFDAAAVRIRIHRGYDGPTAIRFFRKRKGEPIEKEFTISLFRRTGDFAFWK